MTIRDPSSGIEANEKGRRWGYQRRPFHVPK
jgi:hypothetical protein